MPETTPSSTTAPAPAPAAPAAASTSTPAPAPNAAVPPPGGAPPTVTGATATKPGESASDARRAAVSGWMTSIGGAGEEPAPAPAPAAQKPAPAQPAGASPASGTPPDPDKWPRTAAEWDNFKRLRNEGYAIREAKIKSLEKDLAEREAKLAGFANAVDPKEHESVRTERDQLSQALRLAAVEKHPRFVQYYDGKVNAQIELAKRIVGPELAPGIAEVLKMPDNEWRMARLEETLGSMSPLSANRLGGIVNAIDELRAERESEITKAREDYDRALAKQNADATQAQQAARSQAEAAFDTLLKEAQGEKGITVLKPREGDDAWNTAVANRVAAAKQILFGNAESPDHLIRAALSAVSFAPLLEELSAMHAENESLKTQVAQLKTATPTLPHGARPAPNGTPPPAEPSRAGLSRPMQVAKDWMGVLNQTPNE